MVIKCICGKDLSLPAAFIGYTELHIPVAQFTCECGKSVNGQIDSLKPYTADKSEKYPPERGNYFGTENPQFCCPICKGIAGIKAPIHSVGKDGKVSPSYVCPYGCGFHSFMTLSEYK